MQLSVATLALLALPALAAPAQDNYSYGSTKTVTVTVSSCPKTSSATSATSVSSKSSATSATSATSTGSASSTGSSTSAVSTTSSSTADGEYPTATATSTWKGKGLDELAKKSGRYLGTAADIPGTAELDDKYYLQQLDNKSDFGQLTPANMMKYFATEPQRGVFNYTGGDYIINRAKKNGQIVRCHNLIWHSQLPDWLTSQTWDNATLISIMENHITSLVKHFGTGCAQWDVVNEALNENGTLRSDVWLDTIGPAYLPMAFKFAQKAAPKGVKLFYNDYNIENPGAKATAAQNLIKSIKAQGIRVDGAGLQSHFIVGETPSQADQEANMAAFTALGVDVAITELDVRAPTLPVSLEMQAQQKKDFYSSTKACFNTKGCVGITLWDFVDQYSWIPSTFPGQGYGTPWFKAQGSGKLVRKSAYDGIAEALAGQ